MRGADNQAHSLLFIQHDWELYAVYQQEPVLSLFWELHIPSVQLPLSVRLQLHQHHVEGRQASSCGTTVLRVSIVFGNKRVLELT